MNDDLISRQAVDDAIYDYSRSCDVNYAQIMEYIDKIPSVNPQEPKTGHWIVHPKGGIFTQLICDKCLLSAPYDRRTNYCPNCGAKMVEPQESEIHCNHTDAEIAKSFIEDVEAVKDLLPQESEEISDTNLKMWEEIFKAESGDEE